MGKYLLFHRHNVVIMVRIMYIMLNAPEHLKDMLRRLDSCMSKNFWPISLIPSLPFPSLP